MAKNKEEQTKQTEKIDVVYIVFDRIKCTIVFTGLALIKILYLL
jgi:hypothetical protein